MLYVTTRNFQDTYTAAHTLERNRGEDGGFWIPYREPSFSAQEIAELKELSFNKILANMLNIIFGTKLTGWDIDFCIGRYPVRLKELSGKVVVVESWHNPKWTFENMVSRLTVLVGGYQPTSWSKIAVRISLYYAVYGELLRTNLIKAGETIDISLLSADFVDPISVLYARKWGLPVENVICCCNENNNVWNLICQGQMRTDMQSISTCVPEADVVLPEELERFIALSASKNEVQHYLDCCRNGKMYIPGDQALFDLRKGIFVSVVGSQRIRQTIGGVFATHDYILSPIGALTFAGLQDYRAKKGQIRMALVMTDKSPCQQAEFVADVIGLQPDDLMQHI